ncbi:MAG: NAD-glutamate dehydrogenase [Angustibacter sp.]
MRSRARLLDETARLAERSGLPQARVLLGRYFHHVPDDDLLARRPEDLLRAVTAHRDLAAHRPVGVARVQVLTPADDEHGWSGGHTVIQVVTDDMPFLVDSVTAELNRTGRSIHVVVHPMLVVRRDATGELQEVLDSGELVAELPYGQVRESWMHLEVDRETNPAARDAVNGDLRRVLDDVRVVVEDWSKMREAARGVAGELVEHRPPHVPSAEVEQAERLLHWLANGNFTFIGYREYALTDSTNSTALTDSAAVGGSADSSEQLCAVPGTGLGVFRHDQRVSDSFGRLPAQARARARDPRILVLTKANSRSTVHRPAYLDYVGVKRFDDAGHVVGERRFLGLFTSAAYTESVLRVPVIDAKVCEVLRRSGFTADSHSGKDLLEILETYPRDELFQTNVEDLYAITTAVLHLQERRRTRLFLRRDDYGRFMSCLVYLPRDRYTTQMRLRMADILQEAFGGESVDYTTRVSESVLARLHFVVRVPRGQTVPDTDAAELEQRLIAATRTWDEDFTEVLRAELGEQEATRVGVLYAGAFPEAFKEAFPADVAVFDVRAIAGLLDEPEEGGRASAGSAGPGTEAFEEPRTTLYHPAGSPPSDRRFKLYRRSPVSLTAVLPIFGDLGVEVTDERPYSLDLTDGRRVYVYDFGLTYPGPDGWSRCGDSRTRGAGSAAGSAHTTFQEAFAAVWSGRAESDRFNALVLGAGLTWRQVSVLRAYVTYLRQGGLTFSRAYVESALAANVDSVRQLVELFETRFDPDRTIGGFAERQTVATTLATRIAAGLDEVASLDHDRILRGLLGAIQATVRTTYFQVDVHGLPRPYLAFKVDPHAVPELPRPWPEHEVWVYSPRVEGVHLRFGRVARGGLRWSDRREDFRTEILGLVKAQVVKNAVIVPTGAKGGFVTKQPPDPNDREAFLAEGIASYRTFISALLDLTDNLSGAGTDATVVPPPRLVRYDGDDTYLVVAADKGTASFSDIANQVAADYGFWLGDAFASGGSAGYDHKAMGITARGAWESVKRHFRELGLDTQTEDVTVVGVGDMSGDVFGNGMLLSRHIRLVAAFDHRHVFLDPDPDPAVSHAERRRLFELPSSSWDDYDRSLISSGGGVWPRSAKAIPVSPQIAQILGIPLQPGAATDQPVRLIPTDLLRAILVAPVDLLWNGGIGTYVKSSAEGAADAGDRANDLIRVNGSELRCRVVGEGGNLGLTQLGRIEAASHGVRVNTDAIDNSAGVDTSDHEVNIKILLSAVLADGGLTLEQRGGLLASMTDDVASLVLRDNYEQNVLLGNAREQAHAMMSVHQRLIRALVSSGQLNRELEFLPSDAQIARRQEAGLGLTSPEFSVLVAYAKNTLGDQLLASELPDDPWFATMLRSYFPAELVRRYGDRLDQHPLRRQIITTVLVNNLVNRGGITFAFRLQEEIAATPVQVARAYVVAREVFDLTGFVAEVEALDNRVPTRAQTAVYLEFRRLIDRAVRWLLQSRPTITDIAAEIDRFAPVVSALRGDVPRLLVGAERQRWADRQQEFIELGVPADLAGRTAVLLDCYALLDITEVSRATGTPAQRVAPLYFVVSERFGVDAMLAMITRLPRGDRWDALARAALRYDLYLVLEQLTTSVLRNTGRGDGQAQDPRSQLAAWEAVNREALDRVREMISEVRQSDHAGISALSVALRALRGVVRSTTSG